ncbi:PREDICTED: uncharacterized protein LOC105977806 [Erythranthe guttata]|uniref:uncharacterized protein LOC105977806 n=1 Tax=Erythranthe guttata TaxID=4155 RepID=UPI00064D7917|nr:PREDICTED: uncharacterized protein LOC105977806 [Erythranthe guttata]|eukprot:XP_012858641.1 PREDICTED: uncharacterized protein LOC105977806 [Erythranthe guttata]
MLSLCNFLLYSSFIVVHISHMTPSLASLIFVSSESKTESDDLLCSSVDSNIPLLSRCKKRKRTMSRSVNSDKQPRCENAQWPFSSEEMLVQVCYDSYLQGQLLTTTFSSFVWGTICEELNKRTEHKYQYSVKQCKQKFNRIRAQWKLYYRLLNQETGYGIDEITKTITGDPERLASVVKDNKVYARMLKTGVPNYDYCTEMFYKNVANGYVARSSTQNPANSLEESEELSGSGMKRSTPEVTSEQESGPSNYKKRGYHKAANNAEMMQSIMDQFGGFLEKNNNHWQETSKKSIDCCVSMINQMKDLDPLTRIKACTALKSASMRHVFLALDAGDRWLWVNQFSG